MVCKSDRSVLVMCVVCSPSPQAVGTNIIRCRKDGNWTGSFRLCPQIKGQCSLPQNLHPSIRISCKKGHGIGDSNSLPLFLCAVRSEPCTFLFMLGLECMMQILVVFSILTPSEFRKLISSLKVYHQNVNIYL